MKSLFANGGRSEPSQAWRRRLQLSVRSLLLLVIPIALIAYLLLPGHLLPGNVDVEFQLERFEFKSQGATEKPGLVAVMSVKNNSGNTLWYQGGGPGFPNTVAALFVNGAWDEEWNGYGPDSETWRLPSGGRFVLFAPVRENAEAAQVGFFVASRWWGEFDTVVLSDRIQVDLASAKLAN